MADKGRTAGTAVHPLDPLVAEEIAAAARIIRAHEGFGEGHRFVSSPCTSTATRPSTCRRPQRTGTAGTRGEGGTG